jgi:hypothetical protein
VARPIDDADFNVAVELCAKASGGDGVGMVGEIEE